MRLILLALALAGCGTVQRYEAHQSTRGGYFVEACLYRSGKPIPEGAIPLKCELICTSPIPVSKAAIERGKCAID